MAGTAFVAAPQPAGGVEALWVQAQLPGAPPSLRGAHAAAVGEAEQTGATGARAVSVAAAAISVAALATGRAGKAARGRRAATARQAEKAFAGGLIGGESAFGEYNFDPLGLAERSPQYVPWFREAELKHGRIAMMAWVGLVFPDIVRIPGPDSCYSANVVDAHNACVGEDNLGPLFQVFMFCGVVEMLSTFPKCVQGLTLENAGDYRLGVNFLPAEESKVKEMKLKELKNGRLAMLAFGGAITQAVLTGTGFPWLYADRSTSTGGPGLAASVPSAWAGTSRPAARVAMQAEGGYKMSKSVPFLPVSPALEGYVGEEDGFDPMGVSLAIDIRWLREAELKHGRVCMLATVGWIATDLGMRVPGDAFQVSTIEAHDALVKSGAMPQMLCWLGYAELFGFLAIINMMEGKTERKPGDFGIRLLYPTDEKAQYEMQLKELRNGRLAMLAYGGIVTAAVLTGGQWPFFATGAGSRSGSAFARGAALCGGLQGFARQMERGGVAAHALEASKSLPFMPKPQNLQGFVGEEQEFDPLGFSDTFDMRWLREAELKHGRVCMIATLGFVVQQYVTLPGMTPTEDALQAVYTAPAGAMAALLVFAGYIESSAYGGKLTMLDMFEGSDRAPGDLGFGSDKLEGKSEAEIKDLKLKELNNGRLAMMAIGGMVHHNLVVQGPLFPLIPAGWEGPQGSWEFESVMSRLG